MRARSFSGKRDGAEAEGSRYTNPPDVWPCTILVMFGCSWMNFTAA
jgi:hypothetical protein